MHLASGRLTIKLPMRYSSNIRKQQLTDAGLSDHYASLVMSQVDTACVAIMFNRVPVELGQLHHYAKAG